MVIDTLCVAIFGIVFVCLLWKIDKLKRQILDFKNKNPTETDLELATFSQLVSEIKKRPTRFLMIFPKFKMDYELKSISLQNVSIDCVGMPPSVAADVMKVTCDMFDSDDGKFYQEN